MNKSYLELYLEYKDYLASATSDNEFYSEMDTAINSGTNSYSLFNRYFDKKIDLKWVEEIEAFLLNVPEKSRTNLSVTSLSIQI